MKRQNWLIVSILVSTVCISGCTPSQAPPQLPTLHLKSPTAWHGVSDYGVQVNFNRKVTAVKWAWHGTSQTIHLRQPQTNVILPLKLKPKTSFSVTVEDATGPQAKAMKKHVTLRGTMPEPLALSTNPGIWKFAVSRSGPFTLNFSMPIKNQSQVDDDVHFSPSVAFHVVWKSSRMAEVIPNAPLGPTQTEMMTIQGGLTGPQSTSGQYLANQQIVRPFITKSDEQIVVTESRPQTLTLYRHGRVVLRSLCNTGVTGAKTPPGHYYVHAEMVKDTMKGVNPDGTKYDDPNVPWVMQLFGNTAIHGYPRRHYGFPQSNGCVELPVKVAKRLYQLVKVGTPVTIDD